MSDPVDYVPFETTTAPQPARSADPTELERLYEVPVELAVEIGRTHMTIRETLALGPGSIVTLNRLAGEPVDLLVNGKPIARGEVVVIDEEFGLRVTEVVVTSPNAGDDPAPRARAATDVVPGVAGETSYPEPAQPPAA
jgi:flagellar motor switch protein FliN